MKYLHSVAFLILGLILVGCASPNYVIYPASDQGQDVEQLVRGGYTFLRSEKEGTIATVSLRRATGSYVQTYVSLSNRGKKAIRVIPEEITVRTGKGEAFSAYHPEEAPSVVRRVAERSRKTTSGMNDLNFTGSTLMGAEEGKGEQGGYGPGSDADRSYLDLMFREQTLSSNQASSGLVFAPFTTGIDSFQMTVPLGTTTHTFRFAVQKEK